MGYIYIYRNKINGKRYIGQTTKTVEERFANGRGYKNQVFGKALKKYGRDNFDLISVEVRDDLLDSIETILIKEYDTMNPLYGYNCESGGNKNKHASEKTKNMLSSSKTGEKNPMYGKHHSDETKKKMSESNVKYWEGKQLLEETKKRISGSMKGEKNPNYGKHFSEEHRKKISESNERCRYIIQSPSGELFETTNMRCFCKEHSIDQSNLFSREHTKGYILISKEEL